MYRAYISYKDYKKVEKSGWTVKSKSADHWMKIKKALYHVVITYNIRYTILLSGCVYKVGGKPEGRLEPPKQGTKLRAYISS